MLNKNQTYQCINNKYKNNQKILLMIDKKEKKILYCLKGKKINLVNISVKDAKSKMLLRSKLQLIKQYKSKNKNKKI